MRAWSGLKADNIVLRQSRAWDSGGAQVKDVTIWYQSQSLAESVPTRTLGPLRGDGLLDLTSPRGVDHVSLICIFPSLPSTRPFGSSLASGSIGTSKLSENRSEHSHDG